jgi:ComF family protein
MDDRRTDYEAVMAPFLCETCLADFRPADKFLWGSRIHPSKHFGTARAVGLYEKERPFAMLIQRYKYQSRLQLSPAFGLLLFSVFLKYWGLQGTDFIIPVPLHNSRFRFRGFNQSYLPLCCWPRYTGPDPSHNSCAQIRRDILFRIRKTLPQSGLGLRERENNIRGAFAVINPLTLQGKSILLVDDVYTTGATCDECAVTLLNRGAALVDVLTLGQAL